MSEIAPDPTILELQATVLFGVRQQETRSERVTKAVRQAGAAASGMARAAVRAVWTMLGGRHVEETAEKSGPPRAGDHGEPGEAATGDG